MHGLIFQPCNSLELLKKLARWSYGCPLLTLRSKTASSGVAKINLAHKARGMEEEEKRSIGSNITFRCFISPFPLYVNQWRDVDFLEGAGREASTKLKLRTIRRPVRVWNLNRHARASTGRGRRLLCMDDKATGRIAWSCMVVGTNPSPSLSLSLSPVYYGVHAVCRQDHQHSRRRRFFLPVSGTKRGSIVVGAFLGDGLVCGLAFVLPLCAFSLSLSFFCCFLRYVPTYVRTVVLHAGQSSSFRFGSGDCEQRITERVRLARSPPSFRPAAGSLLSCLPCIVHSSTRALFPPGALSLTRAACAS